jgi:hypothetical protein
LRVPAVVADAQLGYVVGERAQVVGILVRHERRTYQRSARVCLDAIVGT